MPSESGGPGYIGQIYQQRKSRVEILVRQSGTWVGDDAETSATLPEAVRSEHSARRLYDSGGPCIWLIISGLRKGTFAPVFTSILHATASRYPSVKVRLCWHGI